MYTNNLYHCMYIRITNITMLNVIPVKTAIMKTGDNINIICINKGVL